MMTPATISNCYCDGSVSGKAQAGGLVGTSGESGNISNSYSTSSIEGTEMAGGLVGLNGGAVEKCYSAGSVVGNSNVGGLVGLSWGGVSSSFWDKQTTGQDNSDGGIGLVTAEMKEPNTFLSAGWDFLDESENGVKDIWRLCVSGLVYPRLSWQFLASGDFNCPDGVDGIDLGFLCEQWLLEELSADVWPEGGDGVVNFLDWVIFADGWQITVDYYDLADFAAQWLKAGSNYYIADIAPSSGDGIVNMFDFRALAENWLHDALSSLARQPRPESNLLLRGKLLKAPSGPR
jgi:hypothetical protein